jgi:hypothetical protein
MRWGLHPFLQPRPGKYTCDVSDQWEAPISSFSNPTKVGYFLISTLLKMNDVYVGINFDHSFRISTEILWLLPLAIIIIIIINWWNPVLIQSLFGSTTPTSFHLLHRCCENYSVPFPLLIK